MTQPSYNSNYRPNPNLSGGSDAHLGPDAPRESDDSRRRGRRRWLIPAAIAIVLVGAAGMYVFQPHRLLLNDTVYEELVYAPAGPVSAGDGNVAGAVVAPEATAPPSGADGAPGAVPSAVAVSVGEFSSLDHPTSGTAVLVRQADGSYVVRLEGLRTDNGPDLRVVLSTQPVGSGDYGDLVELGHLKGNIGDQNYEVPVNVDLASVKSVVIWCERFSSAFGEAPLTLG